jgi:Na+/H+-dicarboxylate symporter
MKLMTWVFAGVFLASTSALTVAAFLNHALLLKVFGLIFVNSVIALMIPVAFCGDDLDIPTLER